LSKAHNEVFNTNINYNDYAGFNKTTGDKTYKCTIEFIIACTLKQKVLAVIKKHG